MYHCFLVRGTRVSAIAAMCTEGVVAYELTVGTVNGEKFFDFFVCTHKVCTQKHQRSGVHT